MNSYIITARAITIVLDGVPEIISASHANYDRIAKALKANDWNEVKHLLDVKADIVNLADGAFQFVNGEVLFEGRTIPHTLAQNMIEQYSKNYDISPMKNFFLKLKQNPRQAIVDELYDFITNAETITLHPDGDILAYKLVRDDYKDNYTGKFDNSVGQKLPPMSWDQIDYDRNRTCSRGYHFCSAGYLSSYGPSNSRVMIVKINPADIAAIPTDYNFAKGRALTYEIIGEVPRDKAAQFFPSVGAVLSEDAFDEEDDFEDDALDLEPDTFTPLYGIMFIDVHPRG